jgi:hypothetical protein
MKVKLATIKLEFLDSWFRGLKVFTYNLSLKFEGKLVVEFSEVVFRINFSFGSKVEEVSVEGLESIGLLYI